MRAYMNSQYARKRGTGWWLTIPKKGAVFSALETTCESFSFRVIMPTPLSVLTGNLRLIAIFTILTPSALLAQGEARTTLGGYGEIHYTNSDLPGVPAEVTLARFVLYVGHSFNDRITFRSELELEDAKIEGGELGGELALEQAYIDYRFSDPFTLRTGLVLMPMGIINEWHEPTTFNGVDRPLYDRIIVPTTWREIGVGVDGKIPPVQGLAYRAYLVSGLDAAEFSGATGVRGGRPSGQESSFANIGLTARVEWGRPDLKVGLSTWYGGSAGLDSTLGTNPFSAPVFFLTADVRYEIGAFAFRGEAGNVSIPDAEAINAVYGNDVGSRIAGWYLEGAWNALSVLAPQSTQRLALFVRYDQANTQASVPSGIPQNGAYDHQTTTVGVTWKPVSGLAFKGDYQLRRNTADFLEDNAVNLGLGWQF
jgi:hypothetical protein